MRTEDFSQNSTGRLVRSQHEGKVYWAFVPNPLPPSMDPDWQLATLTSEADRALSELSGLGRMLPNPNLLIAPFMRREAVLSSRIEGTQADVADLYAYEARQLPLPGMEEREPAADADVREVQNYVRAMEYGLEQIQNRPISLGLICELHAILLQQTRGNQFKPGCFREGQNYIGRDRATLDEATYVPPPPVLVPEALQQLEAYLQGNQEHPPLIRLAFIHYQFEAIHPFGDGNGRIGRLLLSLLILQWGLLPSPLLYLSAFFERHRNEYYDLLLSVSQRGAWREWVEFFLQGVREQSSDAVGRGKRLQDLQKDWRRRLLQTYNNSSLISLMDLLFEYPVLKISQAEKILGAANKTVRINVEKLVKVGLVQQLGNEKYGRTFYAPEILSIITTD